MGSRNQPERVAEAGQDGALPKAGSSCTDGQTERPPAERTVADDIDVDANGSFDDLIFKA